MLSQTAKKMLMDRYVQKNENCNDLFDRIIKKYSSSVHHEERIRGYLEKLWFMPATPILSNGGTKRGLPISCFVNEVSDSIDGIAKTFNENFWFAAKGGGIGTYWGNVRSIGEQISGYGESSGIIPFLSVQNSMCLAISQGSLRRGSSVAYLNISHPEIMEFLDLRKPAGGDPIRKTLHLNHGVVITDNFMEAVENDKEWHLKSPISKKTLVTLRARNLWIKIITTRLETGEPFLLFVDAVNRNKPKIYKKLSMDVTTSNLCSEITLFTGEDKDGTKRTGVCCLSSLNLEKYDEWRNHNIFIEDVLRFLDNVLSDFITNAPMELENAVFSSIMERNVGLGVMGFHSYLQKKHVAIDSNIAASVNKEIFSKIKAEADRASVKLAKELGNCIDANETGLTDRFVHKIAIAPTSSISVIAGDVSPGIEPFLSNAFLRKSLSGSILVKNKHLELILKYHRKNDEETWLSIINNEGSVQHLPFLSVENKKIFKTAFEINQKVLIELAADRTPFICQSQSLNLTLSAKITKKELHDVHFFAWKSGLKSLYYLRSQSINRADKISHIDVSNVPIRENSCEVCQ